MFNFTKGKHKEEFSAYTQEIISQDLDVPQRNSVIEDLTNSYVMAIEQTPPHKDLEILANFILQEHLTDRNPDKMSKEEYPVLSERQQRTRRGKEFTKEESTLDFIKLRKSNKNYNINKRNTTSAQE